MKNSWNDGGDLVCFVPFGLCVNGAKRENSEKEPVLNLVRLSLLKRKGSPSHFASNGDIKEFEVETWEDCNRRF